MHEIDIMNIGGFKIGQAEDTKGLTGCTVFLFDKQSPAGVDIRGGGPASRETPLLNPVADAKGIHALVLSGGSASRKRLQRYRLFPFMQLLHHTFLQDFFRFLPNSLIYFML